MVVKVHKFLIYFSFLFLFRPGSPLGSKKAKKRGRKKKGSDDETFLSDSDDEVTEVERERQQYLAALHASMKV